jgi:glycogen(starch) synthase
MVVLQMGPYPPPHGGVQTNLIAIREHLRRCQIASPVINLTRHRRSDSDGVFYPRTALQVVRLLLTIPADIIHLHIGGRLSVRLLALCLVCSLIPRRRVVLTFHSGGYPSWETGRKAHSFSLRALILRRLDAVIAVNVEIAALFRRLGIASSRIKVICPYVPVSVREDCVLPEQLRSFCESHTPLMTTVGLLEPEYDLPLQISTLATVRRTFPDAGLVIIGSGSQEPELRRFIATQPEGRHVLLCGDVPHPQTVRVISEGDLFLRTTLYDGDSVSVREALQLRTPVIATDNGMRPPGVHLIPRSDPVALCQAIETVLREPQSRTTPEAADDQHLREVLEVYSSLVGLEARIPRPTVPSVS